MTHPEGGWDEFQHEPDLLAAIKAELNTDLRPVDFCSRFLDRSSMTHRQCGRPPLM